MLQHIFNSYGAIEKIYLKKNALKMIGTYDPAKPLSRLIEKLKKGRELAHAGGKTISNMMMVSRGITILAQIYTFNEDI